MTTVTEHPLSDVFRNASLGAYPPADSRIEVLGPLPGPCDALIHFTGHLVVAADVSQGWVDQHIAPEWARADRDPATQLIYFLGALTQTLGFPACAPSVLVAAPYTPAWLRGATVSEGGEPDPDWARYRSDIVAYQYESNAGRGTFAIGRGPADRADVFVRVDGTGWGTAARLGRDMLRAAKTLVPEGTALFGSAPIHDPRALRTILGGGFVPVATEVLFAKR